MLNSELLRLIKESVLPSATDKDAFEFRRVNRLFDLFSLI